MDMLRAERLQRITAAEDRARQLRNSLNGYEFSKASNADLRELADVVTQALQAIRDE